jgi:hypothetical protein
MTERPSGLGRTPTAPPIMANGHFATVADQGDAASYEHGVQAIDGDKEFKYGDTRLPTYPLQAQRARGLRLFLLTAYPIVPTYPSTSPSKM